MISFRALCHDRITSPVEAPCSFPAGKGRRPLIQESYSEDAHPSQRAGLAQHAYQRTLHLPAHFTEVRVHL